MRGYGSPPPIINTESVILRNAPHSQSLKAMGRIAFVGLWRSLRKKFEKLKKFKCETENHSFGDDCHRLCFFCLVFLFKYTVLFF